MAIQPQVRRLSKMLTEADCHNRYSEHKARFGRTPSVRPVVDRGPTRIEVTISDRLYDMPEDALRETMTLIMMRMDKPDLPRFGPMAVRWMESDRMRLSLARRGFISRLNPLPDINLSVHRLKGSVNRMMALFTDPTDLYHLRRTRMTWRNPGDLKRVPVASTDPLMRVICVDSMFRESDIPEEFVSYIIFRELCFIAAYDFAEAAVDKRRYREFVKLYPGRKRMDRIFEEAGWRFAMEITPKS